MNDKLWGPGRVLRPFLIKVLKIVLVIAVSSGLEDGKEDVRLPLIVTAL
jgi:hypothetical protein